MRNNYLVNIIFTFLFACLHLNEKETPDVEIGRKMSFTEAENKKRPQLQIFLLVQFSVPWKKIGHTEFFYDDRKNPEKPGNNRNYRSGEKNEALVAAARIGRLRNGQIKNGQIKNGQIKNGQMYYDQLRNDWIRKLLIENWPNVESPNDKLPNEKWSVEKWLNVKLLNEKWPKMKWPKSKWPKTTDHEQSPLKSNVFQCTLNSRVNLGDCWKKFCHQEISKY